MTTAEIRALAERCIQRAIDSHESYKEGFAKRNPGLESVPPPAGPIEDAATLARAVLDLLAENEALRGALEECEALACTGLCGEAAKIPKVVATALDAKAKEGGGDG